MGTWTHGTDTLALSYSGEADFGPAAPVNGNLAADFNHLMLAFFDRYLKGMDGSFDQPPVKLFVMGGGSGRRLPSGRLDHGGHWRDEQEWPLARAVPTRYHLHAGGRLAIEAPNCAEASSSFRFDPEHPVPMIGGNVSSLAEIAPRHAGTVTPLIQRRRNIVEPGGFDQRERPGYVACEPPYLPLAARQDVLVFQTEPLARAVEVTGPVTVRLWAATSARDTDFTARLIDVYPPGTDWPAGFALNLSDSIKRVRFRNGYEREELVEPGEVFPITIELYPTSNVFAAGHRIRLDISSSNFPRFDVNPNTGEPLGRHTHTVTAINIVFHDQERPSHVELPVIPA